MKNARIMFSKLIAITMVSFIFSGCSLFNTEAQRQEEYIAKHINYMTSVGIVVPDRKDLKVSETSDKDVSMLSFDRLNLEQGPVELKYNKKSGQLINLTVYHGYHLTDISKDDPIYICKDGKQLGKFADLLTAHENEGCKKLKINVVYEEHTSTTDNNASLMTLAPNTAVKTSYANPTAEDLAFMRDYDTIMTKQFNTIYTGSSLSTGHITSGSIQVYVSPDWNSLDKERKKAFVTQATKYYFGILDSKNLKYKPALINIYFKEITTGTYVAKWGSIRGVFLKHHIKNIKDLKN